MQKCQFHWRSSNQTQYNNLFEVSLTWKNLFSSKHARRHPDFNANILRQRRFPPSSHPRPNSESSQTASSDDRMSSLPSPWSSQDHWLSTYKSIHSLSGPLCGWPSKKKTARLGTDRIWKPEFVSYKRGKYILCCLFLLPRSIYILHCVLSFHVSDRLSDSHVFLFCLDTPWDLKPILRF